MSPQYIDLTEESRIIHELSSNYHTLSLSEQLVKALYNIYGALRVLLYFSFFEKFEITCRDLAKFMN